MAAAASPPSTFTLDRAIFNPQLYTRLRTFWFGDLASDAAMPNANATQRWFGLGKSEAEKENFDGECRENFIHALDTIGPEKLVLPEFESYEREIETAEEIAAPFLPEIRAAQKEDEKKGADTLLSILLLLDQMSRNIFREPEGLRKVYLHYDRLAFTLLYASMNSLPSDPVDLPFYRRRPVYKGWLLMPLMHSEHSPSHELWNRIVVQSVKELREAGETEVLEYLAKSLEAEEKHEALLKRFGRYPHRNEFVGRDSTKEEEEYLNDGDTFGVKRGGDGAGAKKEGKSEL